MRKALLLVALAMCWFASPACATSYFMSPSGSDSNSGTSSGSPWLTPNHSVNCGDTITAAASTSYAASSFASGNWGAVSGCGSGSAESVAWVICATFDACKISTSSADGMRISASNWGVQGFEVTTTGSGLGCFTVRAPSSTTIHHIIIANNVANGCQSNGINSYNNGSASTDYLVIVGNIVYNAAQGSGNCYSGISIYQPAASDTNAGTHLYVAGNFSYANTDPSTCAGGTPTDGEGIIFDTFDGSQGGPTYSQQAVAENNMLLGNGGQGFEIFHNTNGSAHATVYAKFNTVWGNATDSSMNATFCGQMLISFAQVTALSNNLAMTSQSNGCGSNPLYVFYIGQGNGNDTVATNWGYSAAGHNCGISGSGSFSCGSNTFGTNPSFSSASTPGAPSCGSATSVPNCMATVLSNFTPSASGSTAYGYQTPTNGVSGDALFPAWLCNVNLPAGLVTENCGTGTTGTTIVENASQKEVSARLE